MESIEDRITALDDKEAIRELTARWYADHYRKVDGQWKFSARDFKPFHMVPLSKGWA